MGMPNRTFKEIRDELAKDYVRGNECEVMDTYDAHEATYKNGFDAADKLHREAAQVLIGIVETNIKSLKFEPHYDLYLSFKEALEAHRKKLE